MIERPNKATKLTKLTKLSPAPLPVGSAVECPRWTISDAGTASQLIARCWADRAGGNRGRQEQAKHPRFQASGQAQLSVIEVACLVAFEYEC
jgi:hypothetical protein